MVPQAWAQKVGAGMSFVVTLFEVSVSSRIGAEDTGNPFANGQKEVFQEE